MKLAISMYDGDSIIRRGPETQIEPVKATIKAKSTPIMVQRKMTPAEAEPFAFDRFEIERRARALRAAAVRSALVGFWGWLERSFENARRRREEEYLARAQSVAELEARLRKLERSGQLVRI
jgi:hypothetical protein